MGLAAGDAVGTTVEFKKPGTFPVVTDMVGGGPFRLNTERMDGRHLNGPLPGGQSGCLRWF